MDEESNYLLEDIKEDLQFVRTTCGSKGALGARTPLPPRFLKSCSFQAIVRENPLF